MTQCHARISRENLPVPLKLEKKYYKLTVVNRDCDFKLNRSAWSKIVDLFICGIH